MANLFSEYRTLMRRSVDHPDDPQHDKALEEFKRSVRVRTVSAAHLRPILAKARSRLLDDWWTAMDLLTALAGKNAGVQDALFALSNSKKVNHRFAVVACLSPLVPKSLAKKILRKALDDRASTVRQKAAEAADRLGFEDLTADMEQRLAREADPKTRKALQFHASRRVFPGVERRGAATYRTREQRLLGRSRNSAGHRQGQDTIDCQASPAVRSVAEEGQRPPRMGFNILAWVPPAGGNTHLTLAPANNAA
jgi:hypothetical protein